jgi:outer membrane protein assembly factor BamA
VPEADLLAAVRPFVGSEYSRGTLENVARETLPEMYRRRSYWGARVAAPVPIPDPGCGGAIVRIAVDEGPQYTWQRTEWIGASALEPRALDRAMRLSRGRPAGLTAIDDGLLAVRRAYERQGYIRHAVDYEPRLDAESGAMVLRVTIAEGPLFRFGSVEFDGAAAPHARALERRWRLKPGDAYDRLYAERFGQEEVRPLVGRRDGPPARLSFQERVDEATQVVHVRFVVGSS